MKERLDYPTIEKCVHEKIEEYINYWENEPNISDNIRARLIESLKRLKEHKNIYQIGEQGINEFDKINSDDKIMRSMNKDMKERTLGVYWGQIYKIRMLLKSLKISTQEMVASLYKEVVSSGIIGKDEESTIKIENWFRDIPDIAYERVSNEENGNSLIFAGYLSKLLHENGIKNQLIVASNNFGNRYAVLYREDNSNGEKSYHIANPYRDIKFFTKKGIEPGIERANKYNDKTATLELDSKELVDNSRIDIEEFLKQNNSVCVLGDPYNSNLITVGEAIKNRRRLVPKSLEAMKKLDDNPNNDVPGDFENR